MDEQPALAHACRLRPHVRKKARQVVLDQQALDRPAGCHRCLDLGFAQGRLMLRQRPVVGRPPLGRASRPKDEKTCAFLRHADDRTLLTVLQRAVHIQADIIGRAEQIDQ